MIDGVHIYDEKRIPVPNGDVFHACKKNSPGFEGFGEVYFSQIECGKIKGWKRHNRLPLNIVVPYGEIKFVIYDDRENSSTKGEFVEVILSANDNYKRLYVAPGLWMAFEGLNNPFSILMDLIPEIHTPEEADRKLLDEIPYFNKGN